MRRLILRLPGHCDNNDPKSFRVAVPYCTYQLKPHEGIITTGTCAGSH